MNSNRQMLTTVSIIVIIGIIGVIVATYLPRTGKIAVAVHTLPSDTSVIVNQKTYRSGTIYLDKGEVSYEVEAAGFESKKASAFISDENNEIFVSLNPVTRDAEQWIESNSRAVSEFEAASGSASARQGEAFRSNNPITSKLPYISALFKIGYITDPSDKTGDTIIITITAPEQYRQDAIDHIATMGYRPGDFTYRFTDERSPFTS